jgi:hypothetical protein
MKNGEIKVEDTEENRQICRKYCGSCPSYKHNSLGKFQPDALFCARGTSSAPSIKEVNCYCPACELFDKNNLNIGRFCNRRQ